MHLVTIMYTVYTVPSEWLGEVSRTGLGGVTSPIWSLTERLYNIVSHDRLLQARTASYGSICEISSASCLCCEKSVCSLPLLVVSSSLLTCATCV